MEQSDGKQITPGANPSSSGNSPASKETTDPIRILRREDNIARQEGNITGSGLLGSWRDGDITKGCKAHGS